MGVIIHGDFISCCRKCPFVNKDKEECNESGLQVEDPELVHQDCPYLVFNDDDSFELLNENEDMDDCETDDDLTIRR